MNQLGKLCVPAGTVFPCCSAAVSPGNQVAWQALLPGRQPEQHMPTSYCYLLKAGTTSLTRCRSAHSPVALNAEAPWLSTFSSLRALHPTVCIIIVQFSLAVQEVQVKQLLCWLSPDSS